MTLPASGEITLNDVNVELGNTGTDAITIGSADVRDLFGVASGEITMADGYGKSSVYSIDNSLRFDKNDNAKLARTPSSAGNRKTWTWSCWVKRGAKMGSYEWLFSANNSCKIGFNGDNQLNAYTGSELKPTQVFRDPSAWFHILWVMDTTQGSASNREKIYINGEQVTDFASTGRPSQNASTDMNNTVGHHIGWSGNSSYPEYNDGYKADMYLIDGTACSPSDFGETGDYGEWKPKSFSGSYGTNGFHLDFASSGSLGNDANGSNNWSTTNISSVDQVKDSPTNNFCTLNPVTKHGNMTYSQGNLYATGGSSSRPRVKSTWAIPETGDWYWEVCPTSGNNTCYGVTSYYKNYGAFPDYAGDSGFREYEAGFADNSVLGIAVNRTTQKCRYRVNSGSWSDVPFNNSFSGVDPYRDIYPFMQLDDSSTHNAVFNFGQDSSFGGVKTAQGNTDGNGYGDFYYTPPSGYLALCTANLPDPVVVPSEEFNTVLYTGDAVDGRTVTGVGFQPDMVWVKCRSNNEEHNIFDAVRGAGSNKALIPNSKNMEGTDSVHYGYLNSFDSDGFTLKRGGNGTYHSHRMNLNGGTFVAWNWKANGSGSTNTNGSINSTVSANQDAGFSIVSYSSNSGSVATVGHGLTKAPEFILIKGRSFTDGTSQSNWQLYNSHYLAPNAEDNFMTLNSTGNSREDGSDSRWNDTDPTSSVFTIGTDWELNYTSSPMIAYCFHSVNGYSKAGTYTGFGGSSQYVYLGFRPKWVFIKRCNSSGQQAPIYGSVRDPDNPVIESIKSDTGDAAYTNQGKLDFHANGFSTIDSEGSTNSDGGIYFYYAIAEQPFKHTNAR